MFDLLQWKDTQPGQLMDSKLRCVFELPDQDEPLEVVDMLSSVKYNRHMLI